MNKLKFPLIAMAFAALPVNAQSVRIDVPFEFDAGPTAAPSGQYIIEYQPGSPLLGISGIGRGSQYRANLLGGVASPNRTGEQKLVFHRYGDQYFLAQVWTRTARISMPTSHREREFAAKEPVSTVTANALSRVR